MSNPFSFEYGEEEKEEEKRPESAVKKHHVMKPKKKVEVQKEEKPLPPPEDPSPVTTPEQPSPVIAVVEPTQTTSTVVSKDGTKVTHGYVDSQGIKHYMFFANLKNIKKKVEEILQMDPHVIDKALSDGHDWANDHVATSKDDIEEVHNWVTSRIEK